MVLDYNKTYKLFIEQLRRDGIKIEYDTEIADMILDEFDCENIEDFIGDRMSMLVVASPTNAVEALKIYTHHQEVSDEAYSLFLDCTIVERGDCPACGGWISDEFDVDWDEDDHGKPEAYEIHGCCSCGYVEKRYDTESIREGRDWEDTMRTLNLNR